MSRTVSKWVDTCVEVELTLDEFDTQAMIDEVGRRGAALPEQAQPIIERAYNAYRAGNLRQLDTELRALFDAALGRLAGHSPLREIA